MNKYFNFKTTYNQLPEAFFQKINPTPVLAPSMLLYNEDYAREIGVLEGASEAEIVEILSGNKVMGECIAQAYGGHQFGQFSVLGDGRAVLLGEHITPKGERLDIQLKGSGKTNFSRSGDGRASVGPMLREYLISEAMHALGIKTTRSLAVVATGQQVLREKPLDGAILTRVARSHIRVGTFQLAMISEDKSLIKMLADYTIARHYPEFRDNYLAFFANVMDRQMNLVVDWMRVAFIHGVMNTDNVSIVGDTIDYGPCAFMDRYDPMTVFSSIDYGGRYCFANQAAITGWNMERFAESIISLISEDRQRAISLVSEHLEKFRGKYEEKYFKMMSKKLGFKTLEADDIKLIEELLGVMKDCELDYTNTFLYLRSLLKPLAVDGKMLLDEDIPNKNKLDDFCKRWLAFLEKKGQEKTSTLEIMEANNPVVIPRNQIVDRAIKRAEMGDFSDFKKLLEILKNPYDYSFDKLEYMLPSKDKLFITYCGT